MKSGGTGVELEMPKNDDTRIYMEMCAALIAMTGETEVAIPGDKLPMKPFSIWRKFDHDNNQLIVRLVEDK